MKKSSLKNYIAFLEAAAAANASDHWMRQHELKDKELLEADNEIAELKRRLDDNGTLSTLRAKLTLSTIRAKLTANATDYWMREHERRVEELLEADNEIAKLERRLDDSGNRNLGVKLTAETCEETIKRLREDNERLSRLLRFHRRRHASVTPRSTPSAGSSSICS